MKKISYAFVGVLAVFISASGATAATLNFDDISINQNWVPLAAGYGAYAGFDGFDWGNTILVADNTLVANKNLSSYSSLFAAAVSGDYAAINNYGSPYVIRPVTTGQTFTFSGAYFTTINGAYSRPEDKENDNTATVVVQGYDAWDTLVYQDNITTHSNLATYFYGQDHFQNISKLIMYGEHPSMYNSNFWMDNFTYNASVPEPSTMLICLLGFGTLLAFKSKTVVS